MGTGELALAIENYETAGSEKSDPLNSGKSDPSRRRARRA